MHSGRITGNLSAIPCMKRLHSWPSNVFSSGEMTSSPASAARSSVGAHVRVTRSASVRRTQITVSLSQLSESCPVPPPLRRPSVPFFFHAENTHTHKHIKLMRVTFLFHGPRVLVLVFIYVVFVTGKHSKRTEPKTRRPRRVSSRSCRSSS